MKEYKIYPLINLYTNIEQSMQTYAKNFGKRVDTPIVIWLIQGNGRNILVDTGACDAETASKYHHKGFQTEDMLPQNLLRAHGVDPKDIHTIILSHLHWDHCYNLELFPNAKIYVQKTELLYAIDPLPIHALFYESHGTGITAPWIPFLDQMVIMEGDYEIAEGINVYAIPAHSPGMQNVVVNTSAGKYMIATDNIPSMLNWTGIDDWEHVPSPIHVSMADYYKAFKRIGELADFVLPGHDKMLADYPVFPPEK